MKRYCILDGDECALEEKNSMKQALTTIGVL